MIMIFNMRALFVFAAALMSAISLLMAAESSIPAVAARDFFFGKTMFESLARSTAIELAGSANRPTKTNTEALVLMRLN